MLVVRFPIAHHTVNYDRVMIDHEKYRDIRFFIFTKK